MTRAILGLLILVTLIAYAGVWSNGWVYEDRAMLDVAAGHPGLSSGLLSRNAARLSVYLPARVLGPGPRVQHVVGVAIHLINGLLVFALMAALAGTPVGLIAAAVFLLHPIQVETAAYVASRPDLVMTTGLLGALWLASGRWVWWKGFGILACVVLALSAKQTGIVVLPLLALLAWYLDVEHREGWAWTVAGLIACCLTLAWVVPAEPVALPYTPLFTAAYQSAAFWRLVSLVVWPVGFSIDHNIGATPTWAALLALAGLGLLVLSTAFWRRTAPLLVLAVLWPVLMVGPRLLLALPEFFNAHQFYGAMPAVSLLIGLAAVSLSERNPDAVSA